jgi:hypothetical protein
MRIRKILPLLLLLATSAFNQSCTNYTTDLNQMERIKVSQMTDIISGQSCSNNLFGGFTLPYIGDTAIKISGDQSVITAIKNANITKVYAVDKVTKSYILYSKRCTIVFGKKDSIQPATVDLKEVPIVTGISLGKDKAAGKKEMPPKFIFKKEDDANSAFKPQDEKEQTAAPKTEEIKTDTTKTNTNQKDEEEDIRPQIRDDDEKPAPEASEAPANPSTTPLKTP